MRTPAIVLADATELVNKDWFAPLSGRSLTVSVRNIHLADARDTSQVLGRPPEPTTGQYGFRPIRAGGTVVTNELVNELRDELGF